MRTLSEYRAVSRQSLVSISMLGLSLLSSPAVGQQNITSPEEGTLEAGGFHLRYRMEGRGIPTLVIGSSTYYPRVFSRSLRDHLRLVFLDHRGFAPAPSDIDPSSFELDTLVEDIERARKAIGLDRFVIVGHSGHGYMALEYAKKYPDRVSHVVMIGTPPDLSAASEALAERYWQESVSPERKSLLEANRERVPNEALASLPFGEIFIKTYIRDAPRIWFDPAFDSTHLWQRVEINEVVQRVWGEVFPRIDVAKGLESLDCPVLLALGRYDFLIAPPSAWDLLREKFKNLTVRVFERSGTRRSLRSPSCSMRSS